MIYYDIEAIKANADPYEVAVHIGMQIREGKDRHTKQGNRRINYILCPGHPKRLGKEDRHFGSCYLTKYGYRCHACNVKVGVIDMVMEYLNCSFGEALQIVAETIGGAENYIISGKNNKADNGKRFPLSKEELSLIDLYPYRTAHSEHITSVGHSPFLSDLPSIKQTNDDGPDEYLFYTTEPVPTIQTLYEEDSKTAIWLIKNKVKEKLKKLTSVETLFLDRSSPYFNTFTAVTKGEDGYWEDDELYFLREQIRQMKRECLEILKKIHD